MNASGAISIVSSVMQPLELLGVDHVVERVVERAQVRIDLLLERAGQEAEPLAGLDRGARQDDAADLLVEQRAHRERDRQVRLAGAGGADARTRCRCSRTSVDVLLLRRRPWARSAGRCAASGSCRRTRSRSLRRCESPLQELHRAHDVVGRQRLARRARGRRAARSRLFAVSAAASSPSIVISLPRRFTCAPAVRSIELEPGVVAAAQRLQRLGIVEGELLAADGLRLGHVGVSGPRAILRPAGQGRIARVVEVRCAPWLPRPAHRCPASSRSWTACSPPTAARGTASRRSRRCARSSSRRPTRCSTR